MHLFLKQISIYALCADDGTPRYIGKAVVPARRLNDHMRDVRLGGRTRKCNWIRSIGKKPKMVILETVSETDGAAAEMAWIAGLRQSGFDLTNLTDGGDGTPGWIPSDETLALQQANTDADAAAAA